MPNCINDKLTSKRLLEWERSEGIMPAEEISLKIIIEFSFLI
jgi:hypothetical protein